jgi:DNA repair exonuclease SbcCD nuclease subunit
VSDPAGSELIFEDLSLAIWARGIEEHTPANRPLSGFRASDERYWRMAIAHGLFVPSGITSYRSSQIHAEEIAALECDYLALGHVHIPRDLSAGKVTAWYSGSPNSGLQLVSFDPVAGIQIGRRHVGELVSEGASI